MAKKRLKKIAVVHCSGNAALKEGIDRQNLPADCGQILENYPEGILECAYGCLGGGSCAAACRLKAITFRDNHSAKVDREKCVGCGLCARACPKKLIRIELTEDTIQPLCSNQDPGPAARKVCTTACIGCGICERNCPADAIHVIDGCAVIDPEKCIACGMCAVKCPRGVIYDAFGIVAESM